MVLKPDQERVKALLKETITLLCKNGLHFKNQFSIEAVIGVTLDEEEVFLVSVNELISADRRKTSTGEEQQLTLAGIAKKARQRQHRKRKLARTGSGGESEDGNNSSEDDSGPDEEGEGGEESGSEVSAPTDKRQCQQEIQESTSHSNNTGNNKGGIQIKEEVDDCVWTNPNVATSQQLQPSASTVQPAPAYPTQEQSLADLPDINMIQAGLITSQAQWLQQQELQAAAHTMAMARTPRTSTITSPANISQSVDGESMNVTQDSQQMTSFLKGPFPCTVCGKVFDRRYSWIRHEKWHQGKYECYCPHCDKGFSSTSTLKGHIANVHTGVKDYKCELCDKAYAYKHHLKDHIKRNHKDLAATLF